VRGLFFNLLGTLGKAFTPVFFILVGRLYGAAALGVYLLVFTFIEMLRKLAVGGLNDGIMIYTARNLVRPEDEDIAYRVIGNSIFLALLLCGVIVVALELGLSALLPMYEAEGVQRLVRIMAAGLPLHALPVLLVSATKAHVEMKWDALMGGFIRPFGLFFFALVCYWLDMGMDGLAWGYLATGLAMSVSGVLIFLRHFSLRRLLATAGLFKPMRDLVGFVIPQSLNLTFIDMIAGFDIMMLGFFGVQPALIGYYGIAAQLVYNIEQVRKAFSGAYAPVIARLYREKHIDEMNTSFNKVSRWTMLVAFPVGMIVVFFHRELLQLFHPAFGIPLAVSMTEIIPTSLIGLLDLGYLEQMGETGFMILLLMVPLLSCGVGLAGNLIVMTGKSAWSLLNSGIVAGLSFLFAALLIPEYGLYGAALSAALAAVVIRAIQLLESELLLSVRLHWSLVYKPWLAAAIGTVVMLPAMRLDVCFGIRLMVIAGILFLYFFSLRQLGFEDGDTNLLMPWRKKQRGGQ